MTLVQLAYLLRHLFLVPNWLYSRSNLVVSNTWCFSRHLDNIWVSHLHKSQTTPIIHHNECYLSKLWHTWFSCPRRQTRQHVAVICRPTYIVVFLSFKKKIQYHFFTCDTTNIRIELGFHWQMTHVESANEVVHLHNIEWQKNFPP